MGPSVCQQSQARPAHARKRERGEGERERVLCLALPVHYVKVETVIVARLLTFHKLNFISDDRED